MWVRWGDAVREAGFLPQRLQAAYDDEFLIEKFIEFVRSLGRYPVAAEAKLETRRDSTFPSFKTFARFGSKQQFAALILDYCKSRAGYDDVIELCSSVAAGVAEKRQSEGSTDSLTTNSAVSMRDGYVYMALLQLGREQRYKIGKTVLVERRKDQISIQLPEDLKMVHTMATDDPSGIEKYWHTRFAAKRNKGEWFSLSRQDIDAFKRRKFM